MKVLERREISKFIYLKGFRPEVLYHMEVTGSSNEFDGSLARLLLNSPATAVYHLSASNQRSLGIHAGEGLYIPQILLGVNYSGGAHSEGEHKIVIQDVATRRGPWVLYAPPGSHERTFYLQDVVFPHHVLPRFDESEDAPLKIRRRFYHSGDPMEIFKHFQALGYEFVDHTISEGRLDELEDLHYSQEE